MHSHNPHHNGSIGTAGNIVSSSGGHGGGFTSVPKTPNDIYGFA